MALISCPECGKPGVSLSATSCPYCGFNIREATEKFERAQKYALDK